MPSRSSSSSSSNLAKHKANAAPHVQSGAKRKRAEAKEEVEDELNNEEVKTQVLQDLPDLLDDPPTIISQQEQLARMVATTVAKAVTNEMAKASAEAKAASLLETAEKETGRSKKRGKSKKRKPTPNSSSSEDESSDSERVMGELKEFLRKDKMGGRAGPDTPKLTNPGNIRTDKHLHGL